MVLVDTSIWVDHFRIKNDELSFLLENTQVACHPFVVGELACGGLKDRRSILSLLNKLPATIVAEHEEVLSLIEQHSLMGQGIGWIDAHLLTSALISKTRLWTRDKNLKALSVLLDVLY